jgi:glycolate oxidase FAD binding subunit
VLFEGFGAGVDGQGRAYAELARSVLGVEPSAIETPDDAQVASLDEAARTFGNVRLRISTPPAFVPSLDDILAPLRAAYQDSRTIVYPTVGATFIGGLPRDGERFAPALNRARAAAEAAGGNLVVIECSEPALRERVDVFGTLPNAFAIMRRLKERFDPERRLNPGRFVGGL